MEPIQSTTTLSVGVANAPVFLDALAGQGNIGLSPHDFSTGVNLNDGFTTYRGILKFDTTSLILANVDKVKISFEVYPIEVEADDVMVGYIGPIVDTSVENRTNLYNLARLNQSVLTTKAYACTSEELEYTSIYTAELDPSHIQPSSNACWAINMIRDFNDGPAPEQGTAYEIESAIAYATLELTYLAKGKTTQIIGNGII